MKTLTRKHYCRITEVLPIKEEPGHIHLYFKMQVQWSTTFELGALYVILDGIIFYSSFLKKKK